MKKDTYAITKSNLAEGLEYESVWVKDMELDSVRLLGLYPGFEIWKAGLLLEDNGLFYDGYWGINSGLWDGRMTFCTGEKHGDWVARLLVENEKVVDI